MAQPFKVDLVSPEKVLFSGEADMVITRILGEGEIAFQADVEMHGSAAFLILFGNPNAELPNYPTDLEVRGEGKGPQIVVSRTHPGLIKRLFELEVPEIADGIVEIKACAREPGHRTKIAVWSNDHNVDPVGACVGARGGRVRMVVNEMRGEKIDIVPFSEDLPDFVAKALSPAKVTQVIISEDGTQADVIVPDHQLSLAIGREGQNARLSARLTGVRVDIRSETQLAEGVPAGGEVALITRSS